MSDDWQLGTDGKYHWLSWWGVGKCGFTDFYQQSKPLIKLDNADICPHCMSLYFYQSVKIPASSRCLT